MTPKPAGQDIKLVAIDADIDISAPLRVTISVYRGEPRFDVRHLWVVDGEQRPTKKGINIPLDEARTLIDTMLTAYNESTGSHYQLCDAPENMEAEDDAEDAEGLVEGDAGVD
jgi:hypothetical protein